MPVKAASEIGELVLERRRADGGHRDDAFVPLHLLDHRFLERLGDRDLTHWLAPYSANMSTSRSFGSG
jgi:hypothetical protein